MKSGGFLAEQDKETGEYFFKLQGALAFFFVFCLFAFVYAAVGGLDRNVAKVANSKTVIIL